MKKAIFAGAFALAALTSCQNSESSMSNPEDQKGTVFQNKAAARGEELPPLSKEEEQEVIQGAIKTLKSDQESELSGNGSTDRAAQILCHTNYASPSGHACVYSNGYLVQVDWGMQQVDHGDYIQTIPGSLQYSGHVTTRCNC